MKTSTLPIIALLGAIAASFILPVGAVAASIAVSTTGMLSVFAADYGRSFGPLAVPAAPAPRKLPRPAPAEYRAAA
ncbi:MAG TPA: hypothetical protein VKG78_05575 [Opitutaceae bacterium]|nr:hypothetical protein [Opitutaceae bacterium]